MVTRLPVSRVVLFGCAAILAAPSLVTLFSASVARADSSSGTGTDTGTDAPQQAPPNEVRLARMEMDATIARMQSTSRQVRNMLRDARKRGTRRQVTCVDEALSRVDVAHRSAREQESEALAAYARNDLTLARGSRVRIAELDEAHRLAARDGASCVPHAVVIEQKQLVGTVVHVVVDPRIAPERP